MSLKHSYTLLAPLYDSMVARATASMRQKSLAQLGNVNGKKILLCGVGTGLDFEYLPQGAEYHGVDLTPAMLQRAQLRIPAQLDMRLQQGDVTQLPYDHEEFDIVICHLILAVIPNPEAMLLEVQRVLKPGGEALILDKFLRPGQLALSRRLLNLFIRHIATRTDVVFEHVLKHAPQLQLLSDEPTMAGGWFRSIRLQKSVL